MAEIEEELSISITSENFRLITGASVDKIIIEGVQLSDEDAATFAWLINKPTGTVLELEIKVED